MKLLTTNTKLEKQNGITYLTKGLSLAPHTLAKTGVDVCPQATPACRASCVLWFAGRTMMPSVRNAMINRTRMLVENRDTFFDQLHRELDSHERCAKRNGLVLVVRMNVASDLDWSEVARAHDRILFYDYTKDEQRAMRSMNDANWPGNYQLTLSRKNDLQDDVLREYLCIGGNAAVVFSTRYVPSRRIKDTLPEFVSIGEEVFPVIDGDERDTRLRAMDGCGVVVGLRFKGSLKRKENAIRAGFCIDVAQLRAA
jgi:hypothetical protein